MFKSSFDSAFGRSQPKRQEKQTGAQTAAEGAGHLSRFHSATKDKSKGNDIVSRIQAHGRAEAERQKKKKAEEAAKPKTAAPSRGFFGKMIDKYVYGKKE